MKKRIKNGDIENAKMSNKIVLILTIMMMIIVISGICFYIVFDKGIIDIGNKNDNSEENIVQQNEDNFDVSLENVEALRLFDIVKVSNNNCGGYNTKKSVNVDDMTDKCKFSIASHIYSKYLINNKYIKEDEVKYSYESLFGEGTYKTQKTIPYNDNTSMYYDSVYNNYVIDRMNNYIDDSFVAYEKIISVRKSNNYMYINTSVLYYDRTNNVLCSDYKCDNVLKKMSREPNSEYYDLYIDSNKKNINDYQYKFKLDKNGFYKYISFERVDN